MTALIALRTMLLALALDASAADRDATDTAADDAGAIQAACIASGDGSDSALADCGAEY